MFLIRLNAGRFKEPCFILMQNSLFLFGPAPPIAVESPQGLGGRAGQRAEATLGAHAALPRPPTKTEDLQRKAGWAPKYPQNLVQS